MLLLLLRRLDRSSGSGGSGRGKIVASLLLLLLLLLRGRTRALCTHFGDCARNIRDDFVVDVVRLPAASRPR